MQFRMVGLAIFVSAALSACANTTSVIKKITSKPEAPEVTAEEVQLPIKTAFVGGAEMFSNKTILTNAQASADHETLVTAVKSAGLSAMLDSEGPYTVFAPTDAAFDRLPFGTVDTLLASENRDVLTKILSCHVMSTKALAGAIVTLTQQEGGTHTITTVGGCDYTARYSGEVLSLEDGQGRIARVTIANVEQSNGVIHVIDNVLLP